MKRENALERNLKEVKWVLGIVSGKGGVGKSSVTANLALALKNRGKRVGILDADVYGPSMRKMLPENLLPSHCPENPERILPALAQGIKVASIAYFRPDDEASIVRAPLANAVIAQLIHQVEWGALEYLLIDFPPGTGDIQLTLIQQAGLSGALIVTTPQEVALLDVRKAMQMCDQLCVPMLGIVENMSYFSDPITGERHHPLGSGGGKRLSKETGIPLLGEISLDPAISACGDSGEPLFLRTPGSPSVRTFDLLAQSVEQQLVALENEECLKNFELIWKEMPSVSE